MMLELLMSSYLNSPFYHPPFLTSVAQYKGVHESTNLPLSNATHVIPSGEKDYGWT